MTENTLKLEKKVFIEGEIVLLTGMHVGGSSLGLSIGGADKVVVRNPLTNLPYIPGSSIKGKMRSLLEKSLGLIRPEQDKNGDWEGRLCENPEEDVVQLFGFAADKGGASIDYAPTRLTVRDGSLINVDELANSENTDMHCTEVKTEVSIDRLTSQANPRNFERVPAGARFKLDMVLDIYNVDVKNGNDTTRADNFVALLRQGLMLIEDDYIGGQGTRGYGQVQFHLKTITDRTAEAYRTNKDRESSSFSNQFSQFFRVTGEVA
jgi:CRISPR-associated protein Csm3